MERGTVTTVACLVPGDRFYRANDRKKEVWELIRRRVKKTYYQEYKYFAISHAFFCGNNPPKAMRADTRVVFLRHSES